MVKPKKASVVSTVPLGDRELPPTKAAGIRVLFDTPVLTNRPLTIYKERIVNPENGEVVNVLWWFTEQGEEVGRYQVKKENKLDPDDKTFLGYDYTILATSEEIDKIKKEAFGRTQFAIKDGDRRYQVSKDAF